MNKKIVYEEQKYILEQQKQLLIKKLLDTKNFYLFCCLFSDFHKNNRHKKYIKEICDVLEKFIKDELYKEDGTPYKRLIISMPPGTGKSYTIILLITYYLAFIKQNGMVINTSYSLNLSRKTTMAVRDFFNPTKKNKDDFYISDFFQNLKPKRANNSKTEFSLNTCEQTSVYASSIDGTLTGLRANLIICDDWLKGLDSLNAQTLEKQKIFFDEVLQQRLQSSDDKIIVIQTQWNKDDLIGYLEKDKEYYVIKKQSLENYNDIYDYNDKEKTEHPQPIMLNDNVVDFEEFKRRKEKAEKNKISKRIFYAIYQQRMIESDTKLYNQFNSFKKTELFNDTFSTYAYLDNSVGGADWFCCLIGIKYQNKFYITDYIYEKYTSQSYLNLAKKLKKNNTKQIIIEKNQGGKMNNDLMDNALKQIDFNTKVVLFHQSKNKIERMVGHSKDVQEQILFEESLLQSEVYRDIISFDLETSEHDDAPDCLTAVFEHYLLKKNGINKELLNKIMSY